MRHRPRVLIAALIATLALVLSSCTTMPTRGPVEEGDVDLVESNPLYLQVYGPVADSTPEQIVQGFLTAQAGGASDNFETARKFLDGAARNLWNPNDQVTVFSGDTSLRAVSDEDGDDDAGQDDSEPESSTGPTDGATADASPREEEKTSAPDPSRSGSASSAASGKPADDAGAPSEPADEKSTSAAEPEVEVTLAGRLEVTGTLDADGRYTEASSEATQDVRFTLERDSAQQWRITKTGDGALIQEPNFNAAYRSANVYFLSPDQEYLVPETRWFPQRNTATYVTRALLSGPSTWLRDSVSTAFPMGTDLAIDAVTTDDSGTAKVELTAPVLDAEPVARALLVAQIEATLMRLPGISAVEVLAGGSPLSVTEVVDPVRDPLPLVLPRGVRGGKIVQLSGRTISEISSTEDVAGRDVTALGFSEVGNQVVIRSGTTDLVLVPEPGGRFVPLMTGPNILAPSVDRFGWVWSGSDNVDGALRVVQPGGEEFKVGADWLEDQDLVSARVSRDGTRIAVISERADTIQIDVAGIIRDASNTPQGLSNRTPVGASMTSAEELVWVDEVTLAVLGQGSAVSPETVHIVPVGEHSSALTPVDGAVSLAAGRGQRTLFVRTKSGDLWSRSSTGTNWSLLASDFEVFSFPG